MYNKKKILAFIPARKGSKGIINKNKYLINGLPLFQYSVDVAKKSKYIDDIIVSSDSEEILALAHELGCIKNKLRPKKLSLDSSKIIDAILYELKENDLYKYNAIVLLQPTCPYRTVEMLNDAIEKYFEYETSLITVTEVDEHPVFMRKIKSGKLIKIIKDSSNIRRQKLSKIYKIIGSIYINNVEKLNSKIILNENEIPYIIDKKYDIDIDTYDDLKKAIEVLKK